MTARQKAALSCHMLVALGFVGMGLTYLLMPRFMPYHARVVNAPWGSLGEPMQMLLLVFMRGAGVATLAVAAAIMVLLWIPFRRGQAWARHAVAAIGLAGTLPLLALMLWLEGKAAAGTPYVVVIAAIGLQLAGWVLSMASHEGGEGV